MGQRARHDTPFLRLFHCDGLLKTATLGGLVSCLCTCVHLLRYKVQHVAQVDDYEFGHCSRLLITSFLCNAKVKRPGDSMLTQASNTLDVDNHCSAFRPCVSALTSETLAKNPELILPS